MVSYDAISEGVIKGDGGVVVTELDKALSEGAEPRNVLVKGLIGGMSVIGERFRAGDMFLPEVLMCTNAMHKGLDIVKPLLVQSGEKPLVSIIIGTVEGDIHDIGKRIVGFLLEGNGFEVIDLGVDVEASVFANAIEEHKPDILGMSALLTITMPNMARVIDLLKEKGLREKVKVIIGGAPVNEEFAESIGADGYAEEAISAVELVKKLVSTK